MYSFMERIYWSINLTGKPVCHYIGTGVSEEHNNKTYSLPNLWSIHLYDFEGTLTMEEGCLDVHPGDIGFIPPGKTVTYAVYGTGTHLACHFRLDTDTAVTGQTLPGIMPTGAHYPEFSEALHKVLHLHAPHPLAADVKLWSLLLDAEQLWIKQQQRNSVRHPALEKCIQYIELNLEHTLRIAELTEHAGVSHPYLVHLFRKHQNCTISEYIRQRRMARAKHLLTETDQPVKSIAIDCGFTDLQYFNKCIRKAFGISPRAFR
ncbi:AraC family transcriptional regulator [Verrucomicrobia bacterium S94]|nr:AraC family transcriptional regulator [Verrucomicrobia bacterium S94]